MTHVDAYADDHWEAERAAFRADPAGDGWDRCAVPSDGPPAQRFGTLAAFLLEASRLHEAMERVVSAARHDGPGHALSNDLGGSAELNVKLVELAHTLTQQHRKPDD